MKALFKLSGGIALVACLACGGGGGGGGGGTPGSLVVTITGLPGAANASVTVTGPNGFSQALTATQTLSNLAAGAYTVTAADVTQAPYSYSATVTGSPATVTASASASATVTYAASTGALQVTISGLPSAANASVMVTGPGGFSRAVTATTLLATLAPGTYTVAVTAVRANGTIVDQVFGGTGGGTAAVAAGATATNTVTYSLVGGTGRLWIALSSGAIAGYDDSQLVSGGAVTPAATVTTPGTQMSVVFDGASSAWTVNLNGGSGNGLLDKYTPSQVASTGAPTAAVEIAGSSLNNPVSMAFDAAGGAWITNISMPYNLVKFTAGQLGTSGSPIATTSIGSTVGGSLNQPVGLAFEASGNLWVANQNNDTIVMYTAAQLGTGGTPTPVILSNDGGGSLNLPLGLALDSTNNLWVSNGFGNSVVKFLPAQRGTTGAPIPDVTLTSAAFSHPTCLAFDKAGSLWVVNTYSNQLLKFTAAQLVTGSPTPTTTITGLGTMDLGWCAFSPAPANLPLH